jgi:putative pyruvate formate lyase activating enzyme
VAELHGSCGIHNVNFVTPDHVFPQTGEVVRLLRGRGVRIPVVYNLSGYQRTASLMEVEQWADIYLPDFKYADAALAGALSRCPDYAPVALDALSEMVRQKGFLDVFPAGGKDHEGPQVATRGVLVRHLILPGETRNSLDALTMLFVEFGPNLPLSLMSQYVPVAAFPPGSALNRTVTKEEFDTVFEHALSLGFRRLYFQRPEGRATGLGEGRPFLPDFSRSDPFSGNTPGPAGPGR